MPACAATSPFVETRPPLDLSGVVSTTSEISPRSIIPTEPHVINIQKVVRTHLVRTDIRRKHTAASMIQRLARVKIAQNARMTLRLENQLKKLLEPKRKWYHFTPSWCGGREALKDVAKVAAVMATLSLAAWAIEESPAEEMAVKWWKNAGNRFYKNNSPDDYAHSKSGFKWGLLKLVGELFLGISFTAVAKHVIFNPKRVGLSLLNSVINRTY